MAYRGVDWKEQINTAIEVGRQGKTLNEIGHHFGVSRQRIKQIFMKYGIDPKSVGVPLRSKINREEKARLYFKKWGNTDQDLYQEKRKKWRAKKANATRLGTIFTIAFSELDFPTHCPILGIELDYFAEGRQENSVSFDRRDPNQGYILGNTFVISWRANRVKNNGTAEEHQLIADYLK